jgi:hypothetical protein
MTSFGTPLPRDGTETAAAAAAATESSVPRHRHFNRGGVRITVWRTVIVVAAMVHMVRQDFSVHSNENAVVERELSMILSNTELQVAWNSSTQTTAHAASSTDNTLLAQQRPAQAFQTPTTIPPKQPNTVSTTTITTAAATAAAVHKSNSTATTLLVKEPLTLSNSKDGTPTTTTAPTTSSTAWCILGRHNTRYFVHFPHAMEFLSQCWSYHVRMVQQHGDANIQCGIRLEPNMGWHRMAWAKDLMQYAQCQVVISKDALPESELSFQPPFNASLEIGSIWFDRPDHAMALKDAVLLRNHSLRESNHSTALRLVRTERLHIGLVIRPRRPHKVNRAFVNQDEIVTALSNAFPSATLTIVELGSLTMWQQAAFLRRTMS